MLEIINEFSEVAEYVINTEKSAACLVNYQREVKVIASQRIKYLELTLGRRKHLRRTQITEKMVCTPGLEELMC